MTVSPVLVVAGPTASGKSALSMRLAHTLDGVVINADSMQVYRELRILTARPTAVDEASVPHRLYGMRSAAAPFSVGYWRVLATAAVEAAHAVDRLPIVVGGTGLYLRALMQGLADVPSVPGEVRRAAAARLGQLGLPAFRAEVLARDPAAGHDPQRLLRAWEVVEATGRPLGAWRVQVPPPWRFCTLLVTPPRDRLYAACDARFEDMIAAGALDEVRALQALDLPPGAVATKALGVPALARHLAGEQALAVAIAEAQRDTRRYAKRQLTWFRHQLAADRVLEDAQLSESSMAEIFAFVRHALLTRCV